MSKQKKLDIKFFFFTVCVLYLYRPMFTCASKQKRKKRRKKTETILRTQRKSPLCEKPQVLAISLDTVTHQKLLSKKTTESLQRCSSTANLRNIIDLKKGKFFILAESSISLYSLYCYLFRCVIVYQYVSLY